MKQYLLLGALALALAIPSSAFVAPKGKPKPAKQNEAQWEVLGVFEAEDFKDEDDFEMLSELGEVVMRNYQRFESTNDIVLISKKKLQVEEFQKDGKRFLALYGQEQLGKIQIMKQDPKRKVQSHIEKLESLKDSQGKAYELYAENDKNAPARCYAAGTRVLFPPYRVSSWNQCVNWARSTGVCRQVEFPQHYPELSTDGCKCFY